MDVSSIVANVVSLAGRAAIAVRRMQGTVRQQAIGNEPEIPPARPQGALPTLKMPSARGWRGSETPVAAPGLKVNAFARDLEHPRWLHVLPNGDVLVAEAATIGGSVDSIGWITCQATIQPSSTSTNGSAGSSRQASRPSAA